jgi:hypothetical protein
MQELGIFRADKKADVRDQRGMTHKMARRTTLAQQQ